jgi:hypothetical protein
MSKRLDEGHRPVAEAPFRRHAKRDLEGLQRDIACKRNDFSV